MVIAELQAKFKVATADDQVLTLRDIIVNVTDESLLRLALGSKDELAKAKQSTCSFKFYPVIVENLSSCVREAFPGCDAVKHDFQRSWMNRKFNGWGFTKIVLR